LENGEVVLAGPADELLVNRRVIASYLGIRASTSQ
jgi:ABC-type branched-subunit amino acid transport system ATPase component